MQFCAHGQRAMSAGPVKELPSNQPRAGKRLMSFLMVPVVRELPLMTSTEFFDFFDTLPVVRIWN